MREFLSARRPACAAAGQRRAQPRLRLSRRGSGPQPDSGGRIAQACNVQIGDSIGQNCGSTNLAAAFPGCNPADANAAATA